MPILERLKIPARRSNQSILREPWILIGMTDAEAEAPILWPPDSNSRLTGKDPDTRKDWRQKEKRAAKDEMVGWHHHFNGHELGCTPGDGEGLGGLAGYSPWGHKESDTTKRLNNNKRYQVERGRKVSCFVLFPPKLRGSNKKIMWNAF